MRRPAFFRHAVIAGLGVLSATGLPGCTPPSSHLVTGAVRPPIAAALVKVYSQAPPSFEEIAVLDASSKSLFAGGQRTTDKVIERLKIEAAKLGANGIILEGIEQTESGSIGTGIGSDSYSAHGSIGLAVGGSLGIFKSTGRAQAVYVPTG